MIGVGGTSGRALRGVGFWAQQPLLGVPPSPDPTKIFRGIWRSLPEAQLSPEQVQLHSWNWSYNLNLIGKDKLPVGAQLFELPPRPAQGAILTWLQSTTALTLPPPRDTTHILRAIWRSLPDQPAQPLLQTWSQGTNPNLERAVTLPPPGIFSQDDWPNPTQPWRLDQTWYWQYNQNLIGQDKLPAGEQSYTLVPSQVVPEQIQLHSWAFTYNLNLIGRDRLPTGKYVYDLVPGQLPPPPENLRHWEWKYNQNLIGKDALPTGEIVYELTPRDPREVRTWVWNYNLNLIGQDRFPTGEQVFDLAPRPYDYHIQLRTWLQPFTAGQLLGPTKQLDWPVPTPPYRIDQTFTASYNKNLTGQDAMVTGEQVTDLPPRDFARLFQTWIQSPNLPLTTVVVFPFKQTDWPLTPAAPQPERTIAASYNKNLIGQDQLPIRQQDWPNPIPPALVKDWIQSVNLALTVITQNPFRQTDWPLTLLPFRLDQTFTASYNKNLVGQDKLPSGEVTTDLPPRDPREVRTWTASYVLSLIGQDRLPFRQQDWPLTPAAQREIGLATWIDRVKLLLLVPFKQTDWPNPTQPARDPTLTSWAASYNKNLIGQDHLPTGEQTTDLPPRDFTRLFQTWISTVNLALVTAPPNLYAQARQQDWPNPIQPPRLDQTWTASYNRNLIGKDKLPTGQQAYDLAPRDAQRAIQINTWVQSVNLALITPPQRPFSQFDWPLTPAARQPAQSWVNTVNLALVVPPVFPRPPFNQFEWPLPAPARPLDQFLGERSNFIPLAPPVIIGAQYFLLQPHYINNNLIPAWTVVTEGIEVPVGWVPTLMVDPMNQQAVDAFYNAGPRPGYQGPGYDWQSYQTFTSLRASAIQSPQTHWVQVPGGMWRLTGLGTSKPPIGE